MATDILTPDDLRNTRDIAEPGLFALEDFFAGHTLVTGVFVDRFGTMRQRFQADIEGVFDGDMLRLEEVFQYASGETYDRQWTIEPLAARQYRGVASDMVGDALGAVEDDVFRWRYKLDLPMFGGTWRCGFDDSMYPQTDGSVLNRAVMTRFGVKLGVSLACFRKS